MTKVSYKGYVIHPSPNRLEDGKWNLNIWIAKEPADEHGERNFFAKNRFDSEEESIQEGIRFGKRIIDGKVPDLTVVDL